MTIEVSLLLSGISVAFAIFFGLSTRARNTKKDTQEEAREDAAVMVKLDTLQASMIELKAEVTNYRSEMRALSEREVRNEESLKSLYKRLEAAEKTLRLLGRDGKDD